MSSSDSTSSFCFDLIDTERIIMFSFDWPLPEPVQILTGNTVHCEKVACYISAKKETHLDEVTACDWLKQWNEYASKCKRMCVLSFIR